MELFHRKAGSGRERCQLWLMPVNWKSAGELHVLNVARQLDASICR